MQTLTQSPTKGLEFRQTHDTQYVIYRGDRTLGHIAFNITAMRWEYAPYAQSVKVVGTLEECKASAEADYEDYLNQSTVTYISGKSTPAYLAVGSSWRMVGSGYVTEVTVRTRDNETYTIKTPSEFARQLSVGTTVQLFPTQTGVAIRWTRKPVRRQAIAV